MAQAGYCSSCGENVYLNPDGSCPKGHGTDCVSGNYEVPDAGRPAAPAAPAAPAYQAPAAQPPTYQAPPAYSPPPAYPPAAPVTGAAPPKKKRTGLVIAIVVLVVLLLCCCGGGAAFYFIGRSADSTGSGGAEKADPEKAKAQAAYAFMKAVVTGDSTLLKSVMPSATVAVIPQETWDSFAASSKTEGAAFLSEDWNGSVLTVQTTSPEGTATVTITPSKPDPGTVEVVSVKEGRDPLTLTIGVAEEDGWKVTSMTTPDGTLKFDPEGFKAAITENP